jgi:hypothetical protein
MIRNIAFIVLITLRVFYQPSNAKENFVPFANPSPAPPPTTSALSAKVISFNGNVNNNKVLLHWIVSENENAVLFEVEKSTDGKNFMMIALVFGSDKTETDNYEFYEKAGKKKAVYRIKIVNKDKVIEFSPVIEIDPKA